MSRRFTATLTRKQDTIYPSWVQMDATGYIIGLCNNGYHMEGYHGYFEKYI